MYINSNDLKVAFKQLSSYMAGSSNAVKDCSDFHAKGNDPTKFTFQDIQDLPRVASNKENQSEDYKLHPILAEVLRYKPVFDVIAIQDGDNQSISLTDLQKAQENPEGILNKLEARFGEPLVYSDNAEKGLTKNFIETTDLTRIAKLALADVNCVNLNGNNQVVAIEKDLKGEDKGVAKSLLYIRSFDSDSYQLIDLEQVGVINTGFRGFHLQETKDEYIFTIISKNYKSRGIDAFDRTGHLIPHSYAFKLDGKDWTFPMPTGWRPIYKDIILNGNVKDGAGATLPITLVAELRKGELAPYLSSVSYIYRIHFSKVSSPGKITSDNARRFTYMIEAGRPSKRQGEAIKSQIDIKEKIKLEGVCVVGDRAYTINSDDQDGLPTYFYVDLNASEKDMSKKSGEYTKVLNRIGDFGELSKQLGIRNLRTYGMTEKNGYIYTIHGQVDKFKDYFIVRVKESDLRTGNMANVYNNLKIFPIYLDGTTGKKLEPYGIFFSGDMFGIGIKNGKDSSEVLYFDGKNL